MTLQEFRGQLELFVLAQRALRLGVAHFPELSALVEGAFVELPSFVQLALAVSAEPGLPVTGELGLFRVRAELRLGALRLVLAGPLPLVLAGDLRLRAELQLLLVGLALVVGGEPVLLHAHQLLPVAATVVGRALTWAPAANVGRPAGGPRQ
ncbi:hypothetical protein [Streptomyces sp. NPDC088794]|uniref:hypothetical protein n=1 Tax=Streptomyces sp. NPDC088794 TaxID=3365902 RepID=UPI00382B29AB